MTAEQRVLLIGKDQELSTADRQSLEAVGFTVVRVRYPSQVRFLNGEDPPMTGNDMLRAALVGLAHTGHWGDSCKARAWETICKAVTGRPQEE